MPDHCLELLGQKEPAPELAGRYVDSTDVGGKITTAAGGKDKIARCSDVQEITGCSKRRGFPLEP